MKRHLLASRSTLDAAGTLERVEQRSPRRIRRIAYEAEVCERTVVRYLDGEEVRPSSRERIERTLIALSGQEEEGRK